MSSESSQISEREREILRLVAMGATNQQIANQLNISVNTVKVHLRNIFGKIGAASRTEATVYAIRSGLVSVASDPQAASAVAVEELNAETALDSVAFPHTAVDIAPEATELTPAAIVVSPVDESTAPVEQIVTVPEPSQTARQPNRRVIGLVVVGVALVAVAVIYLVWSATPAQVTPTPPPATPAQATLAPSPAPPAETNRWKSHAALAQPRADFAVTAYDNKIYLIGGRAANGPSGVVERYEPANDTVVSLQDKPVAVVQVQATTIGGRIYVPGGEGAGGEVLATFEGYDSRSQKWETLPNLPEPRSRYALAVFEGQLYLFGGWDGKLCRQDVFVYNPASQRWSQGNPMPTARCNAGTAVVGNRIYVIGGEDAGTAQRANERYDPASGQWDGAAPLTTAVAQPAVVGFSGIVNLALVFDPQAHVIYKYNPDPEGWTTESVPDNVMLSSRATDIGTSVFMFGGSEGAKPGALNEYKAIFLSFLPNTNFDRSTPAP